MRTENFKWTDELVMRFDGWLFTFGMRKEDKIKEFKEAMIKENKQNKITTNDFNWTDELVMRFDGWLFTYGMRKEDKIQEFKEMIINTKNN